MEGAAEGKREKGDRHGGLSLLSRGCKGDPTEIPNFADPIAVTLAGERNRPPPGFRVAWPDLVGPTLRGSRTVHVPPSGTQQHHQQQQSKVPRNSGPLQLEALRSIRFLRWTQFPSTARKADHCAFVPCRQPLPLSPRSYRGFAGFYRMKRPATCRCCWGSGPVDSATERLRLCGTCVGSWLPMCSISRTLSRCSSDSGWRWHVSTDAVDWLRISQRVGSCHWSVRVTADAMTRVRAVSGEWWTNGVQTRRTSAADFSVLCSIPKRSKDFLPRGIALPVYPIHALGNLHHRCKFMMPQ